MFYFIGEPPVSGEDFAGPWDAGREADRTYPAMVHEFFECDDFELGGTRECSPQFKSYVKYRMRIVLIEGWVFNQHVN